MMKSKKLSIKYFGQKDNEFVDFGAKDVKSQWQSSEISFEQGEYLTSNLKIVPNKSNKLGYIYMQTIYGQTFEAGNKSLISKNNTADMINLPANKLFLSGVYGYANNQSINSLGLILFKK